MVCRVEEGEALWGGGGRTVYMYVRLVTVGLVLERLCVSFSVASTSHAPSHKREGFYYQ